MRYTLLILIPLLILSSCETGSGNQMAETIVNGVENEIILIEVPDELDLISDDEQYGNFEIKVPEINDDVMEEGAVLAYIERAATEKRPQRWSQFPQYNLVWTEIGDTTFSYLSYGEGFVRISLQSKTSVEGIAETLKGLKLKLVIFE